MEHVDEYHQLIVKRMFKDGYSFSEVMDYLRSEYGRVNPTLVHRLQKEVEEGNGRAR